MQTGTLTIDPGVVVRFASDTELIIQSNGRLVVNGTSGQPVTFTIQQIDPRTTLAGGTIAGFEQVLWLTLYPLNIGGLADARTGQPRWRVSGAPSGRRWRSVRTALGTGGTGVDLTRGEYIEFWTQVDTIPTRRNQNPLLHLLAADGQTIGARATRPRAEARQAVAPIHHVPAAALRALRQA